MLHDEKDGAPKRARFFSMMTRMMMSMMTMMMIPTFSFKIRCNSRSDENLISKKENLKNLPFKKGMYFSS